MKNHLFISLFVFTLGFNALASAADITDVGKLLEGMPPDVLKDLKPRSTKMAAAAPKAQEQLRKNLAGKTGTFKLTVGSIRKFQPTDGRANVGYQISGAYEIIREAGVQFNLLMIVIPDASEFGKMDKIKKGDKITASGKLVSGLVIANAIPVLEIDIMEAKLK